LNECEPSGQLTEPEWLGWAKRLQAISQNGLLYAKDHFETERHVQVQQIAAEILSAYSGLDAARIRDLFAEQVGYATPKVDVRGVVIRDGQILLVQEAEDQRWTLPGGWADPGESPREAVEREVYEESGYRTRATKLLAVYDRSKHPHYPPFAFHVYKLFIRCEILGGESKASSETSSVGYFSGSALPELSISRVTEAQVRRLFELVRSENLPADFD
jgi:ADP-ribose pyrophosphatase YjhB (NUDIX family)